jgi:hypothetical protein
MTRFSLPAPARHRWTVAIAAVGLALTSNIALASSGNAAADGETCSGVPWQNVDSGSGTSLGTYHLEAGPYQDCPDVAQVYVGAHFYYHCWVINRYGNLWSHVRIANTNVQGWISDRNLSNNGAVRECTPATVD